MSRRLMRYAAAPALALSIMGCTGNKEARPTPTTAPKTGLELLDGQLDVASLVGPVAVNWATCPPGGDTLSPDVHVNAPNYDEEQNGKPGEFTGIYSEIKNVTEYRNKSGSAVVAWCGVSIGDNAKLNINGPAAGTIMVIPNPKGCTPPDPNNTDPQILMCPGQPIPYDASRSDLPSGQLPLDTESSPGDTSI